MFFVTRADDIVRDFSVLLSLTFLEANGPSWRSRTLTPDFNPPRSTEKNSAMGLSWN